MATTASPTTKSKGGSWSGFVIVGVLIIVGTMATRSCREEKRVVATARTISSPTYFLHWEAVTGVPTNRDGGAYPLVYWTIGENALTGCSVLLPSMRWGETMVFCSGKLEQDGTFIGNWTEMSNLGVLARSGTFKFQPVVPGETVGKGEFFGASGRKVSDFQVSRAPRR